MFLEYIFFKSGKSDIVMPSTLGAISPVFDIVSKLLKGA